MVLGDSIQTNVISILLLPHAADGKQGSLSFVHLCHDSVTLALLISPLFLQRVSEIIGQATHAQLGCPCPACSLKPNSLLIAVPFTPTSLHLLNSLMSIILFSFHNISMRERGQGILFSVYRWGNRGSKKHSGSQVPCQVKSELRTSNTSSRLFPEYIAGFPIPEGFSPGSSYWFKNSKGVNK